MGPNRMLLLQRITTNRCHTPEYCDCGRT